MNINELNINEMLKSSFKTLKEMLNDRNIDTTYLDKISEEEIIKLYEEWKHILGSREETVAMTAYFPVLFGLAF